MSGFRLLARLPIVVTLGLVFAAIGPTRAQQIGDAIGAISFKQDATGSVNGFLIENLSNALPESAPVNVQFAHLTLTAGGKTVAFDTALGSSLILTPGTSVDTTGAQFLTDNVLQFPATSAPSSALLHGDLLDSTGKSLNLTLDAVMSSSDLTLPANPGDINAPVTIRITSPVPAPSALAIALMGQGLGLTALWRKRRAARGERLFTRQHSGGIGS